MATTITQFKLTMLHLSALQNKDASLTPLFHIRYVLMFCQHLDGKSRYTEYKSKRHWYVSQNPNSVICLLNTAHFCKDPL